MKPWLSYLSIKSKLVVLTMAIVLCTILIGFGLVIIEDISQFKANAVSQLELIGRLVADYSIADLLFQDQHASIKTLSQLSNVNELQFACIYDKNNNVFAIIKNNPNYIIPIQAPKKIPIFKKHAIQLLIPIFDLNKVQVGTLYLSMSNRALQSQIYTHLWIMGFCGLLTVAIAWVLVIIFARMITSPILYLSKITQEIQQKNAFHIRVKKISHDEIGVLYDGFNMMMHQIDRQQQAQREIESALKKAKICADTANEAKSKFLAKMSHELRTPLNSLLLLAKDLAKNTTQNLTQDQLESSQIIYKSGQRLLDLINNILDISKIEAGKMDIHPTQITIASLISDITNQFKPIAKEKNIQFIINIDPECPEIIISDQQKLFQSISNLLANAFKFTQKGCVKLSISTLEPNLKDIQFEVQDTGIGIPLDKQLVIFEPFHQAQHPTNYGGTGLGLTITREFIQLLGGEITLVSNLNKGSIFRIVIPSDSSQSELLRLNTAAAVVEKKDYCKDYHFNGKKILIAEPDMRTAFTLSNICKQVGLEVYLAQNEEKFQTILKEKQGIQLLIIDNAIFEQIHPSLNIPMIVLSSPNVDQSVSPVYPNLTYIAKPIELDHLLETLKSFFGKD